MFCFPRSVPSVNKNHPWISHPLKELAIPDNELIIMILREEEKIIPNGETIIQENDVLLLFTGE